MTMQNLGHTRSSHRSNHLLHTPDTFVRAPLPGMQGATAIVHVSPAAGAAFTQYTAELEPKGMLGSAPEQRFVYVLDGSVDLVTGSSFHTLAMGSYVYIPASIEHTLTSNIKTRLAVIEKSYQPLAGTPAAAAILVGNESSIAPVPLMGDPDLEVRSLLPDSLSFDFAVNTMTYRPGAALSMVEMHVMEHGLLMLEGGGIYRLGDAWYPVTAGDFIWMGPYCPQWFGALGKQSAKYLIYKDWNRHS
jgi:(S)-ureidoglycine aminohydrolase